MSRSVVIVDDEKSYTEMLGQIVSAHLSCPVHRFNRPMDFLSSIGETDPAVVVSDFFMPEINGFELMRHLDHLAPGAVCIIITGHSLDFEGENTAPPACYRSTLLKPFSWSVLLREILRHWPGADRPEIRNADILL